MANFRVGLSSNFNVLPGVTISPSTHIDFPNDEYVTTTQTTRTVHTQPDPHAPPTLQLKQEDQYPAGPTGGYPAGPTGGYPAGPPGSYPAGPPGSYPPGGYPAGPTGGYAGAQTTTTTTTTTRVVGTSTGFDPQYFKSVHGILKIVQLVCDMIGFICAVSASGYYYGFYYNYSGYGGASWYGFVSMAGFWITCTLLIMYLFHLIERFHTLPWNMIELIFCAVWSAFFLIASIVLSTKAKYVKSWGAAAFFGFCAMLAYGYDAFLNFQIWRTRQNARPQGVVIDGQPSPRPAAY